MQRETKINYGLLLFGAAMPPIIDALFGRRWGLAALVSVACGGLVLLISGHFHRERRDEAESRRKRYGKFAFYGSVLALAFIGIPWAVRRSASNEPESATRPKQTQSEQSSAQSEIKRPATLSDLFAREFCNSGSLRGNTEIILASRAQGFNISIKAEVCMDFQAKAQFIGFYIPAYQGGHEIKALDCALALNSEVERTIERVDSHITSGGDASGVNSAKELVFSGRVFLYHEQPLSNVEKATIVDAYHTRNYDVNFRDLDYAGEGANF